MHTHLNKEQRSGLSFLLREGYSLREAARVLGVSHSTLSRELRRNGSRRTESGYHAGDAQRKVRERRALTNRRLRKIEAGSVLEELLIEKIRAEKWSPEQVSGWLQLKSSPRHVCPNTIYDWIYKSRRELLAELHCRKGKYRRTRANGVRKAARAEAAKARHISRRGAEAELRVVVGHWEGDTVVGAKRSGYLATFVDRKSGYLAAAVLSKQAFGAEGFAQAAGAALSSVSGKYLKTLALDNGPEMAYAESIERQTGLTVYYATPYHSWERGCNENANGLLRYFFPKKMSFADLTQAELDQAVRLLNNRPRKRLNWQTPAQVFKA